MYYEESIQTSLLSIQIDKYKIPFLLANLVDRLFECPKTSFQPNLWNLNHFKQCYFDEKYLDPPISASINFSHNY